MRLSIKTFTAATLSIMLALNSAAAQTAQGKAFKTQFPDAQHLRAYVNAVSDVTLASKDQFPEKMKEVEKLAASLKLDLSTLVAQLRANNEAKAFDAFVLERANKTGEKTLVAEINAAGGAVAMLSKAGSEVDVDIRELKNAKFASIPSWHNVFGMAVVHARIGQTACGVFFWVVTVGYGTNIAYHYCYK